jgi:hypothetical protein
MEYDHKTNWMGNIIITRLYDGATYYLQSQDDVEAFRDVEAGCAKLGDKGEAIMQDYCAEYFAE